MSVMETSCHKTYSTCYGASPGFSCQCGGELGHQPKGFCLPQLQPQTWSSQPLLGGFRLPDVAGSSSIVSRPRILPGVPLAEWHPPGKLKMMLMMWRCSRSIMFIMSLFFIHFVVSFVKTRVFLWSYLLDMFRRSFRLRQKCHKMAYDDWCHLVTLRKLRRNMSRR